MFFTQHDIDRWIEEDIPFIDLTSSITDFTENSLGITFKARHDTCVSGCEAAVSVLERVGCTVTSSLKSGDFISMGDLIIEAQGTPQSIHKGWRVALNLLEYSSGIATRTRNLVAAARKANPKIVVSGTRKAFPGTRRLSVQALMAGGAVPHRLGLSETVLFFPAHYDNAGGLDMLLSQMPQIRLKCLEKKIEIELEKLEDIEKAVKAGVDSIQTDKMTPEQVAETVKLVKSLNPAVKVLAAGGINIDNAESYAASGADMLVTSWMYFGKPADIKATIA
ncbi:MAG: ModD protein [Deferribacterales bacterium]